MKISRDYALSLSDSIAQVVAPSVDHLRICGSLRRMKAYVGDIDIVVIPKDLSYLRGLLESIADGQVTGKTKVLKFVYKGVRVQIFITTHDSWGATIMFATGPSGRNIAYRSLAKKKGMKLTRYGLEIRNTGERICGRTEEEIFKALGKQYKPPIYR